jgi:hypothetical protein
MKVEKKYTKNSQRAVLFTKCLLFSVALIVSHIFEKSECGITKKEQFLLPVNGCGL